MPTNAGLRVSTILVPIATIAMLVLNVMAALGYVNGITPEMISERYPTIVTPAGFAFSIWSLIYAGTLVMSFWQLSQKGGSVFRTARVPYIVSCILNCAWILCWHHGMVPECMILIVGLAGSLVWVLTRLGPTNSTPGMILGKGVFGLYAGWVAVAAFLNFAVLLKFLNVGLSSLAAETIGVAILLLATACAIGARVFLRNYLFALSVAWAATAIAVQHGSDTAIVIVSAMSVVLCLITSASFVLLRETIGNG